MLHLLSSLFSNTDRVEGAPDKALLDAATERAVDGTDGRLRGLSSYRKRLRPAVERAVIHIASIVDALPDAVEISRETFRLDERIRAFFVSPQHMQEVISGFPAVKEYVKANQGRLPEFIHGCLSMDCREKKGLGIEMSGDTLQRDVPQVTVSFFDHRYVGPSDNAMTTRRELENRGFDFLIEKALETMTVSKSQRVELEQQRRLLKRKLDAMRAGDWGMQPLLAPKDHPGADSEQLEKEIESLDSRLIELGSAPDELEQRLGLLVKTLNQAPQSLTMDTLSMNLDAMSVKKSDDDKSAKPISFNQVKAESGERRIILLGYFPTADLLKSEDFFTQAQRYLS